MEGAPNSQPAPPAEVALVYSDLDIEPTYTLSAVSKEEEEKRRAHYEQAVEHRRAVVSGLRAARLASRT